MRRRSEKRRRWSFVFGRWLTAMNAVRKKVVLSALPSGFTANLPDEDQRALVEQVGKRVMLNGYDEDGRAELEFKDKKGVRHFIYLDPKFIEV